MTREEMRTQLPYGGWTLHDGTKVLFNRKYQAINAPNEWYDWKHQDWFYDDSNPPWVSDKTLRKCQEILSCYTS